MNTLPKTFPMKDELNLFDILLKFWPVIVAVIIFITAWTTIQNNIQQLQTRVAANDASIMTANAANAEIGGDVKAINAKLDFIIKHDGL